MSAAYGRGRVVISEELLLEKLGWDLRTTIRRVAFDGDGAVSFFVSSPLLQTVPEGNASPQVGYEQLSAKAEPVATTIAAPKPIPRPEGFIPPEPIQCIDGCWYNQMGVVQSWG